MDPEQIETKLAAARIALAAGCSTVITIGNREQPLLALSEGARATLIRANTTPARAREAWLAGHLQPEGFIIVDSGAARALKGGASLLAVGVTDVEGGFEKGAAVAIKGPDGKIIARGVTAYSAMDIQRIAGHQSEETETILGYRGRPAIVHRDDMVRT
jgi:glutamate 5-kinase